MSLTTLGDLRSLRSGRCGSVEPLAVVGNTFGGGEREYPFALGFRRNVLAHDEQIRVANLAAQESVGQSRVQPNRILMAFVEMPCALNRAVAFAQRGGTVGVALDDEMRRLVDAYDGEHPSAHLEDYRYVVERQRLLDLRQRHAILAKFHNIHIANIYHIRQSFATK